MRKRNHFKEMAGTALCALVVVTTGCGADAGGGTGGGGAGGDPGEQRDGEIVSLQDSGTGGTPRADAGPGGTTGGAGGTGGAATPDAAIGGTPADAAAPIPDAAAPTPDAATGALCAGHEIIDLNAALAENEAYLGTTAGAPATLAASCGGAAGGELVFKYHLDRPLDRLIFRTDYPETTAPTVVYVRRVCDAPQDLACNRGSAAAAGTRAAVDAPDAGDYYVVVDTGAREGGGPFRLGVDLDGASACRDAEDNDGDGLIDLFDPGCSEAIDESEADPAEVPECFDGVDNNENGATDYPNDADCTTAGDTSEGPVCTLDLPFVEVGQGGGLFPTNLPFAGAGADLAQAGCFFEAVPEALFVLTLDRESNVRVTNQSLRESGVLVTLYARSACEEPRSELACSDPFTGQFTLSAAPAGVYFIFAEASQGGRGGGGPVPLGGAVAADIDIVVTPTHRACDDALDNDRDGLTDLTDPGCRAPVDDDETDPNVLPFCANGVDDDGDGVSDFPADDGCTGAGDVCEGVGDDLCAGACVDVQANAAHCGSCGNTCAEGVECIEGFCGGLLYQPGIQQNLPEADLGGWSVCYRGGYADFFSIPQILADCGGRYIAMGCKEAARPDYTLLAMGERDQVFFDTGDQNSDVHEHNGVNWYFSQGWSIGFVPVNEQPARNSCDTNQGQGEQRMCWHTGAGQLNPGYRCGNNYPGDPSWERVILTAP